MIKFSEQIFNNFCQGKPTLAVITEVGISQGIKGYPRMPQSNKYVKYFDRRDDCDTLVVPEKRTMLCSHCRTVMQELKTQLSARYRKCLNCIAKHDALLTKGIITMKSKRLKDLWQCKTTRTTTTTTID